MPRPVTFQPPGTPSRPAINAATLNYMQDELAKGPITAVWDTFADRPDGALTTTKSGHTWLATGANLPKITGGRMAATSTTPGAGYGCVDLGAPVRHIGGLARFASGTSLNDNYTLAAFGNPAAGVPGDCPLHAIFWPDRWNIGNFPAGSSTLNIVYEGPYENARALDEDATVAVDLDHDRGYYHVLLPDGQIKSIYHPTIREANPANWGVWEFGSNIGVTYGEIFAEARGGATLPARSSAASARRLLSGPGKLQGTEGSQYFRPSSVRSPARHVDTTVGRPIFPGPNGWVDSAGTRVGNLLRPSAATAQRDPASTGAWLSGSGGQIGLRRSSGLRGREHAFKLTSTAAGAATCYTGDTFAVTAGDTIDVLLKRIFAVSTARNFTIGIYWGGGASGNVQGPSTSTGSGVWSKTIGSRFSATAPTGATSAFVALSVNGCASAGEEFWFTEMCAVKTATPLTDYVEA